MTNAYLFPGDATGVVEIAGPYSLGVEFTVTSDCWLTAIDPWRSSTAVNPTVGRLYEVTSATTGTPVAGSDVTYSLSGTGWQTGRPTTPPKLTAGKKYRAVVLFPDKAPKTDNYWTSGAGGSGITRNFLTAPSRANATGQLQGSYTSGSTLAYPASGNSGGPNYWIDVLLTDVDPSGPQPGPDTPLFGIDVSYYQAGIDFTQVKNDGMKFVICRIGQGAGTGTAADGTTVNHGQVADSSWATFRDGVKAAGLPLMGYWYLGDGAAETAGAQAARCASLIGDKTIPIMLDWEICGGNFQNLLDSIDAFRGQGLTPRILYAPKSYYDSTQGAGGVGSFPADLVLADARYLSNASGTPSALYQNVAANRSSSWRTYGGMSNHMLQFAQTATVAGKTVDADAFWGTDAELAALFAPAGTSTTPTGGGTYDPGTETPTTPQPGQIVSGDPAPDPGTGEPRVDANPPPSAPSVGGVGYLGPGQLPDPIDVTYEFAFQDVVSGVPLGKLPLIRCKHSITLGGEAGTLTALINVSDPDVRALNPWAVAVPRRAALFVRRVEHYPPNTLPDRETIDWGGIVWDLDPLPGTGHLSLKAATPESYFASRYLDQDRPYAGIEQTAIHADLLTYFQTYRAGASIRVEANPIPTGRLRDRPYLAKDTKPLSELLAELGEVIDGFDWWIRPYRNSTTGRYGFRVAYGYPRLGRLAGGPEGPLQLRYLTGGGGNVTGPPTVRRQGTVVKNEALGLGKTVDDVQLRTVVTAEQLGRAEVTAGYPLLQVVHSDTNVEVEATLRDNAAAKLRRGWASEVLLTKIPLLGTRRPTRADIALGDDTALQTDDPVFPQRTTLTGRVWAIETTCATGDASEKVELTMAGEGLTA